MSLTICFDYLKLFVYLQDNSKYKAFNYNWVICSFDVFKICHDFLLSKHKNIFYIVSNI